MQDRRCGCRGNNRLCVIRDAQPGALDHVEIVRPIANCKCVNQTKPITHNRIFKRVQFRLAPENGFTDFTGENSAVIKQTVALVFLKSRISRDPRSEKTKSPETSNVRTPCARMVAVKDRAPGFSLMRSR